MEMTGRETGSDYNFSYNGKLDDSNDGWQTQDFGARIYNPRLGRFFTEDPKGGKHPNYSPYLYGANRPVDAIDYEGEGPRYPAIAAAFEQRLQQLKAEGCNYSFIKYEKENEHKIVYSVNLTMNGHTINQLYEFNEETDDGKYERMLMDWGVDFYDAVCAASNSVADRAYWRIHQSNWYYKRPENGIPLMFKTWAVVLTMGAAAEAFAAEGGMTAWEAGTFAADVTFTIDDMTTLFYGPNRTFLQYLAEKAGIDPERIEQAKTASDVIQGLADLKKIVQEVKQSVEKAAKDGGKVNDAVTAIKFLDFMQGQIDMQKHYWELMEKGMGDINKKNSPKAKQPATPMSSNPKFKE
jgi:RHS repeat-associated protein